MVKNRFAIFGFLVILLVGVGVVSAASGSTMLNGITLTVNETSLTNVTTGETYDFEVSIENQNGTDYNVSFGTSGWSWNDSDVTITDGETKTFTGTLTVGTTSSKSVIAKFYNILSDPMLFQITETVSLSYNGTSGCTDPSASNYDSSATVDDGSCVYALSLMSWCSEDFNGEKGDLEITSVDITNNGQGDDNRWEYLDEIEIEVTIENTHDDDSIDDVILEIEIRDNSNNTYSKKDFDLNDLDEKVGRVKRDGGEETVIFTIDELPIDLEEGTYFLYVRAYEDGNENEQCVSESSDLENDDENDRYFEFEVEGSEDSTIVVRKNLENIVASCGEDNVEVTFTVYNTGTNDEDKVLVNLYSSALGIDEFKVVDKLKDGKGKDVTFFIEIPEDLDKNSYVLDIFMHYDYDEDEDELSEFSYDSSSDEEGSDFEIGLEVASCLGPKPSISANLESTAEVGKELVVRAIVTNNGEDNDFMISVSNFEAWADLISVTPQTASIKKGEFTEAVIKLNPRVSGVQSFKINTVVDGESSSQSVSVNIADKSGLFGMSSVLTYTVIGIIVLLILILLVLIIRFARKPSKPQF